MSSYLSSSVGEVVSTTTTGARVASAALIRAAASTRLWMEAAASAPWSETVKRLPRSCLTPEAANLEPFGGAEDTEDA